MWAAKVFFAVLAIAWADRLSARQYEPEQREALLIRPEKPLQRVPSSVPCLRPPERPKRVTWVVRDADGNILIIGSQIVRQRC